jgi:hypothetical protein
VGLVEQPHEPLLWLAPFVPLDLEVPLQEQFEREAVWHRHPQELEPPHAHFAQHAAPPVFLSGTTPRDVFSSY